MPDGSSPDLPDLLQTSAWEKAALKTSSCLRGTQSEVRHRRVVNKKFFRAELPPMPVRAREKPSPLFSFTRQQQLPVPATAKTPSSSLIGPATCQPAENTSDWKF